MFKNLSAAGLGISGRQSELIELALTYGFKGFDIDFSDFARRCEKNTAAHASRFINSAKIQVGGISLKTRWQGEEGIYKADLQKLKDAMQYTEHIDISAAWVDVAPASDTLEMKENFEMHTSRLSEIAEVLAGADIRLAVGMRAASAERADKAHAFIHKADEMVKLVESLTSPNAGLGLDTWNWQVGGGTLEMVKSLGAAKIASVRVADIPLESKLDDVKPTQRILPGETNIIDNARFLIYLRENGYKGPVTVFAHSSCFSGMTRDAIVLRTAGSLESLWQAAGFPPTTRSMISNAANRYMEDDEDEDEEIEGEEGEGEVAVAENGKPASEAATTAREE